MIKGRVEFKSTVLLFSFNHLNLYWVKRSEGEVQVIEAYLLIGSVLELFFFVVDRPAGKVPGREENER